MRLGLVAAALLILGGVAAAQPVRTQVVPVAPVPAKSPATAADVLARVHAYYRGTTQLTAKFTQKVTNAAHGHEQTSSGTVYFARPDKMRWEYTSKKKGGARRSFIFDGATLWVVEPANLQVTKASAAGNAVPAALKFLTDAKQLAKEFDVELALNSPHGATVLALTPKQASAQYKQLLFAVAADGRVEKSIVLDANDNSNELAFGVPDTKRVLQPSLFQFDPARWPTYKVVEADAKPAP